MDDESKPQQKRQYRKYRRVTPAVVAKFQVAQLEAGNGSAAVRLIESDAPGTDDGARRAWLIRKKAQELDSGTYIDERLQQIGVESIERIGGLISSVDEGIALKAATFVIDHVRGKALQRSESRSVSLNIQSVLD